MSDGPDDMRDLQSNVALSMLTDLQKYIHFSKLDKEN